MPTADETFQECWDTLWNSNKLDLITCIIKESRINAGLREENQHLHTKISELEAKVSELQEQIAMMQKNSSNSSKPPSSDIVKPPKSPSAGPRKPGGQKGHPGFWRKLLTAEKIDEIKEYRLAKCPDCKAPFSSKDETEPRIQLRRVCRQAEYRQPRGIVVNKPFNGFRPMRRRAINDEEYL